MYMYIFNLLLFDTDQTRASAAGAPDEPALPPGVGWHRQEAEAAALPHDQRLGPRGGPHARRHPRELPKRGRLHHGARGAEALHGRARGHHRQKVEDAPSLGLHFIQADGPRPSAARPPDAGVGAGLLGRQDVRFSLLVAVPPGIVMWIHSAHTNVVTATYCHTVTV